MKNKINAGIMVALIATISTFGFIDSLQAAPDGSQRLRGIEGRAFLVEAFIPDENGDFTIPNPPGGSYCYIFNSNGEWIDERWPGLLPGAWEQHSVGAKTPYSAWANEELDIGGGFVTLVSLDQEGVVTPARGKGVLQLEAITEIFIPVITPDPVVVILTVGYEIDASDCPPPFPPPPED